MRRSKKCRHGAAEEEGRAAAGHTGEGNSTARLGKSYRHADQSGDGTITAQGRGASGPFSRRSTSPAVATVGCWRELCAPPYIPTTCHTCASMLLLQLNVILTFLSTLQKKVYVTFRRLLLLVMRSKKKTEFGNSIGKAHSGLTIGRRHQTYDTDL